MLSLCLDWFVNHLNTNELIAISQVNRTLRRATRAYILVLDGINLNDLALPKTRLKLLKLSNIGLSNNIKMPVLQDLDVMALYFNRQISQEQIDIIARHLVRCKRLITNKHVYESPYLTVKTLVIEPEVVECPTANYMKTFNAKFYAKCETMVLRLGMRSSIHFTENHRSEFKGLELHSNHPIIYYESNARIARLKVRTTSDFRLVASNNPYLRDIDIKAQRSSPINPHNYPNLTGSVIDGLILI